MVINFETPKEKNKKSTIIIKYKLPSGTSIGRGSRIPDNPIDQPWAIYDLCRPINKLTIWFAIATEEELFQFSQETMREGIVKEYI